MDLDNNLSSVHFPQFQLLCSHPKLPQQPGFRSFQIRQACRFLFAMIIEDKLTNSQTNIKNGGLYVTDLAANSNGVGRFYLHVGSSLQTGLDEVVQDDLSVYTIDESLYIKGKVSNNAQFMVYSIDGRLINRIGATSQNLNRMSISGYTPGIYLVKVQDLNKYKPVKFVVGK